MEILTKYPSTRDNDNLLTLKVWAEQTPYLRDQRMLFQSFAISFLNGKYYPPESITRCRRKVQSENPELKGKSDEARQDEEKEVRNNINKI